MSLDTIAITITGTPDQLAPITDQLVRDGHTVALVDLPEMLLQCDMTTTAPPPRSRFVAVDFDNRQADLSKYVDQMRRDLADFAGQHRIQPPREAFEPVLDESLWTAQRFEMSCRFCGCTDLRACPGGCSWYYPGVCSACVDAIAAEHPAATQILDLLAEGELDKAVEVHQTHDSCFRILGVTADGTVVDVTKPTHHATPAEGVGDDSPAGGDSPAGDDPEPNPQPQPLPEGDPPRPNEPEDEPVGPEPTPDPTPNVELDPSPPPLGAGHPERGRARD